MDLKPIIEEIELALTLKEKRTAMVHVKTVVEALHELGYDLTKKHKVYIKKLDNGFYAAVCDDPPIYIESNTIQVAIDAALIKLDAYNREKK